MRIVHEKSETVPPGQELYGSECLARHGSLHMAPKRFRESTTFKQISIHLHRVLDWDIMAVFLRINFTVFVVAVPETVGLRRCSEYCAKVCDYRDRIMNSNITRGILSHDEPYTSSYIGSRTSLCNASCN